MNPAHDIDLTRGIVVNSPSSRFIAVDEDETGPREKTQSGPPVGELSMDTERTGFGNRSLKFVKILKRLGKNRESAEREARPIVNEFRRLRDEEAHVVPLITEKADSLGRLLDIEIQNGGWAAAHLLPAVDTSEWLLVGLVGIHSQEDADSLNNLWHDCEMVVLKGKIGMIRVSSHRRNDRGPFAEFSRDALGDATAMAQATMPKSDAQEAYEEMMCIGAFTMPPARLALAQAHANAIAMGQVPEPQATEMAMPDMGPPHEPNVDGYWDNIAGAVVDGKTAAAESDAAAKAYWGKQWQGSAEELAATD